MKLVVTALISFLLVSFSSSPVLAQSEVCPTDPTKIRSMIGELKETFECSGLNLKSCNQYRAGLVGGSLAASTAAGLALLKRNSGITCLLPGAKTSLSSKQRYDFIAQLIVGIDADAAIARPSGAGCTIPTQKLLTEFEGLKKDFAVESSKLNSEMRDRMLAQRVEPADAKKIAVTQEDWKRKFSAGLETLKKEIASAPAEAGKERVLETIAHAKQYLETVPLSAYSGEVVRAHEMIVSGMPAQMKDALSESTLKAFNYWNISDDVRAEKIGALSNTAAQKALKEVEADLARLGSLVSDADRIEFLRERGYKSEVAKQLVDADNSRRILTRNSSLLQSTTHQLSTTSRLKKMAVVTAAEVRDLARRNGLHFLDTPLFHFREVPGLNNGMLATISRAGKKAIAEASMSGASKLAKLAKYAGPALTVAGKAMAAPVDIFVTTITHTNDAHCGGEVGSQYANLTMMEKPNGGGESCQATGERTQKTDDFLYGLSAEDQLKEVRNNAVSCQMLMRLHKRYAPSQNWNLTCSGSNVRLSGKTANGDGQMISFSAADRNSLQNLEWYSSSFERCAKVSLKDEAFESAQVYEMQAGMPSCGSVGKPVTLGKSVLGTRQNQSDERKMLQEFVVWQASNSGVLGMATECCSGAGSNPMCEKTSGGGQTGGRPANNGGSTRR